MAAFLAPLPAVGTQVGVGQQAILDGLEGLEPKVGLYAEYDVLERYLPLCATAPDEWSGEIAISPDARRSRYCWWTDGTHAYWELVGDSAPNGHTVAWFDGETWSAFEPQAQAGTIGAKPPKLFYLNPNNFALGVDGAPWRAVLAKKLVVSTERDLRYSTEVHRVELAEKETLRRFTLMLDPAWDWYPRRVYELFDDILYSDYELLSTEQTSLGRFPHRYRLLNIFYSAIGHFPLQAAMAEYEVTLRKWAVDEDFAATFADSFIPAGVVIHNKYSGATQVVGNEALEAYDAWVSYTPCEAGGESWYWQTVGASRRPGFVDLADFSDLCGPISLIAICRQLDVEIVEESFTVAKETVDSQGATVAGLIRAGRQLGLDLVPIKFAGVQKLADAPSLEVPFIALLDPEDGGPGHFVCVESSDPRGARERRALQFPRRIMHVGEMPSQWGGVALVPAGKEANRLLGNESRGDRWSAYLFRFFALSLAVGGAVLVLHRFLQVRREPT